MKNFIFILCFLALASRAFAQVPSCNAPIPLSEQFRDMIKNLDKSQIPTGILYESVFPWAELESYDGTSTTDTSSFFHFMQGYTELYNSKFNTNNLIHPNDFETAVNNFHPDKKFHHPFGIIDFEFNTIKPDAVSNGLLTVSGGKLYDVAGRTQSPYIKNTVRLGSILLADNSTALYSGTHYLYFVPEFVKTNTGFSIHNIQNVKIYAGDSLISDTTVANLNNLIIPFFVDVAVGGAVLIPIVYTVVITLSPIILPTLAILYFKSKFSKENTIELPACLGSDTLVVSGISWVTSIFWGAM